MSISVVTTLTGFSFCQFYTAGKTVSKDDTRFEIFVLSGASAHCCHVKERPNCNRSLQFDAKTCTGKLGDRFP